MIILTVHKYIISLRLLLLVCSHAAVQSTGFCFGPAMKTAIEARMLRNYCAVKLSILYAGSHVCVIERNVSSHCREKLDEMLLFA